MNARYRWFRIRIPIELDVIKNNFTTARFDVNSDYGFLKLESFDGVSKYRYFSRSKIVVTKIDDFGNASFEEVATIRYTDFAIIEDKNSIFLRIENPGLNLKNLFNTIEKWCGLGFSIRPVTFRFKLFNSLFSEIDAKKLIQLKVVDAIIEENVIAQINLSSSEGIVKEKIKAISGVNYKIDSATFEITFQGIQSKVSYSTKGIVKIVGKLEPLIVDLVEKNLSNFID